MKPGNGLQVSSASRRAGTKSSIPAQPLVTGADVCELVLMNQTKVKKNKRNRILFDE
jgi:hypothetical protein